MIDYRSDTFTKPTHAMMEAMMSAQVGDDVFREDPTVNRLEKMAADMFGMEAALYCASGTMSNQIGIKCHTQPGDEVICEKNAHVYIFEGGGIAFNSGAQVKAVEGQHGKITAEQVRLAINADDVHKARTSLVCLENTSNRGGGSCYELDEIRKIYDLTREYGLSLHLDGARLFNALIAKDQTPLQFGQLFDSISVCLNKGLGCPMGSILMGRADYIKKARRVRKVFGGGLRQAGFMAATGVYALEHHVNRLRDDHLHAKSIVEAFARKDFVRSVLPVETNILIFETEGRFTPVSLKEKLIEKNILIYPIAANQVRMVTHLDITGEMIEKTIVEVNAL